MSDATGLLDTNIFVDILREYQPAIDWMTESTDLEFAVPSLVRMELILGTNNKAAQERIIRLIPPYSALFGHILSSTLTKPMRDGQWNSLRFTI